ncbi:hypothetical protein ACS0TY_021681 [Phlomoides rotata]
MIVPKYRIQYPTLNQHLNGLAGMIHLLKRCSKSLDGFFITTIKRFGNGFESTRKPSGNIRRIWIRREEKVLLAALKDLVAKGQKTDNGFRTGYLNKLEDALRKAFPGCDLQATPHITSKITTWRKHYSAIVSAKLLATGVGFNTTTCQLNCTNDQWDDIVKIVPLVRLQGRYQKLWVRWRDKLNLQILTSLKSQTMIMYCPARDSLEYTKILIKHMVIRRKIVRRKKQRTHPDEGQSTGERLETIVSRIGYDHDLGAARKQIYEQLGKIEGLSIKDKLHASKIIGEKVETLEMWTTLPDDARVVFVMEVDGALLLCGGVCKHRNRHRLVILKGCYM